MCVFFALRDDIARSKSADFFNQILEKINTYQYSDNRKFLKKKRKRGKKIQVPREQKLHKIIEWQFPKYKKIGIQLQGTDVFCENRRIQSASESF
ncbi:hypothetical protein QIU18_14760 [Capnocytophaga canimorsus]|nr:hypothetical protein [Capnocytophaga canimorsus]WGU70580.1 hypothetical protein QIU18_14760 [Capnocytophaga canimorsus]